jgi:hypothetical protein
MHVARMGEKRNSCRILEARRKGIIRKPRRNWNANNKINIRDIGRGDMNWIHLA